MGYSILFKGVVHLILLMKCRINPSKINLFPKEFVVT